MALHTVGEGERGLSDVLDESYVHEIGGREIEGVVGGELRIAVTDDDAAELVLGPALEQEIRWIGEMSADPDLPAEQGMRQSQEQMTFTRRKETEAGARRQVKVVKPTPEGYGALVRIMAGRDNAGHGFHFVELTTEGVRRDIHLEPLGERFDVKFENFAAMQDGVVCLFGRTGRRARDAELNRGEVRAGLRPSVAGAAASSGVCGSLLRDMGCLGRG